MERITSRQNPLITRLRRLGAEKKTRRAQGVFLCEGTKLVGEALRWGPPPELLAVAEGPAAAPPAELPAGVRVVEVPEALLRAVSTVETPQGMLAVCRTPDTAPPETLPEGRLLVLDGVQDPGNVGTILRTLDAFDADGLLLTGGCADPYGWKAVRSSMGAVFRRPIYSGTPEELAALLHRSGLPLYGAALREDTVDARQADYTRCTLAIGSEGRGLSREVLDLCNQTIRIPMSDRCESLNAAIAAAVLLWESWR